MTSISGVLPLRNANKLGYPWRLALDSLAAICDEVVVSVDPTSDDDTVAAVEDALPPHGRTIESIWDLDNHGGHEGQSEIARQTAVAFAAATHDWILSLQADEAFGDDAVEEIRRAVRDVPPSMAIAFERLYFYGGLDCVRRDWTQRIIRLARRAHWAPDPYSGGMTFVPVGGQRGVGVTNLQTPMFHYSRIGDPHLVALRVRNLDTFYHHPDKLLAEDDVPPYDFTETRKLDTYVEGHQTELLKKGAVLQPFPVAAHPAAARALFGR